MLDVYMALSLECLKGPKKVVLAVANGFRHEFIKILFSTIWTFVQFYEQRFLSPFEKQEIDVEVLMHNNWEVKKMSKQINFVEPFPEPNKWDIDFFYLEK